MNMIDNYSHNEHNIMYITENIPGPEEDSLEYKTLMYNYNSQMLQHCNCYKKCIKAICKCLQVSCGSSPILKHDNLSYSLIECTRNCSCLEDCGNRIVQTGPIEGLIMKQCKNKGLGLFTTVHITPGTFVCEYAGELLTKSQALARSNDNDKNKKMNYLFCLNEHTNEGVIQTFVDPSMFGNIGRYINHSCDPNCVIVPVRYENAIPHLAIFAQIDIYPGTEITFSYGVGSESETTKSAVKQKPCYCGTKKCNGFMPYDNF